MEKNEIFGELKYTKIIVIEGIDGSGKQSVTKLVKNILEEEHGHTVRTVSFPNYDSDSSYFAKKVLNGEFNKSSDTTPMTDFRKKSIATLSFILDRVITFYNDIDEYIYTQELSEKTNYLIFDRYSVSNDIYNGSMGDLTSRELEYNNLGLPKPDLTAILIMPYILSKHNRDTRTHKTKDFNENNEAYMKDIHERYANIIEDTLSSDTIPIHCDEISDDNKLTLRPLDEIAREVASHILKITK